AEHHNRNQIGGGHLLFQKFLGRCMGSQDVVGLHRGHVEKQHDHAAVADRVGNGVGGGRRPVVVHGNDDGRSVLFRSRLHFFDIRVGETGYLLLLAVVGNHKLIGKQQKISSFSYSDIEK